MIEVPATFRAMPRWWTATAAEQAWLDTLPRQVGAWCARWGLTVDGPPRHGSNALVVPVRRDGVPAALRLAPPGDDVASLSAALRFWGGHGVVAELDADTGDGALLLERLDADRSLLREPLDVAFHEIGQVARRLSVPAGDDVAPGVRHTSDDVAELTPHLRSAWERLGRPFDGAVLDAAEDAATTILATRRDPVAVNADLHFDQVLRDTGGRWVVVDPVLRRGDAERTAVEVLWHRVDEMADREIPYWFDVLVESAALDADLARAWALWRVTDYLVWGLEHGLTLDPPRCARVLAALAAPG
ncbi:aminoglycoside phosphotransferase family protein [Promicromonospora thailandica]|uniref:Streptomycin 6-kinase n=1 Tax=Promicromonospora thailandica TaxID=765201 RepID=A0A9X2G5F1_9MICO|nr:aminoglycoside phosphotransferase family protein [Promicromonospora thailandica]MCP2266033.1 streptomycin 6-kinase [Promicromonospora thailandica]BFF21372.1 aminoglycoside phosphotransferase family protein [Promicromonospora thailandica]